MLFWMFYSSKNPEKMHYGLDKNIKQRNCFQLR